MAALQELNAAEEAEENLHEVSSANVKSVQTVCLYAVAFEVYIEWVELTVSLSCIH